MSPLGSLLDRVSGGFFQQAWVVDDLPGAEAAMCAHLGCSEFVKFVMDETWLVRGEEVDGALSLGFARSGDMQIELIQPLEGAGIHFEFLERQGPGIHHFGTLVDDLDASVAAAERDGLVPVMSGQFAGVRLAYIDTFEELGAYVELIEDPNGLLWATKPWRDDRPTRSRSTGLGEHT